MFLDSCALHLPGRRDRRLAAFGEDDVGGHQLGTRLDVAADPFVYGAELAERGGRFVERAFRNCTWPTVEASRACSRLRPSSCRPSASRRRRPGRRRRRPAAPPGHRPARPWLRARPDRMRAQPSDAPQPVSRSDDEHRGGANRDAAHGGDDQSQCTRHRESGYERSRQPVTALAGPGMGLSYVASVFSRTCFSVEESHRSEDQRRRTAA